MSNYSGTEVTPSIEFVRQLLSTGEDGKMLWMTIPPTDVDVEAVAGTGRTAVNWRTVLVDTDADGSSTALRRTANFYTLGFSNGLEGTVLNWSKQCIFAFRFQVLTSTTNGVCRVAFGRGSADGVGDLDDKGIGIVIDNLGLKLQTHNGSTVAEVNPSQTLTVDIVYSMTITSDGAGNIVWYLDGTSVGTSSGGPTGSSATGHNALNIHASNASDSAAQEMSVHDIRIGLEQ